MVNFDLLEFCLFCRKVNTGEDWSVTNRKIKQNRHILHSESSVRIISSRFRRFLKSSVCLLNGPARFLQDDYFVYVWAAVLLFAADFQMTNCSTQCTRSLFSRISETRMFVGRWSRRLDIHKESYFFFTLFTKSFKIEKICSKSWISQAYCFILVRQFK